MIPAVSRSVTSTPENESHHCFCSTRRNPADSDCVPRGLVFDRLFFRRSMSVILEFDRHERYVIVQGVLSIATTYPVGSPFKIWLHSRCESPEQSRRRFRQPSMRSEGSVSFRKVPGRCPSVTANTNILCDRNFSIFKVWL